MTPPTPHLHPCHRDLLELVTADRIKTYLPVDVALASAGHDPTLCPACRAPGLVLRKHGLRFSCGSCGEHGTAQGAIRFARRKCSSFKARMICGTALLALCIRRYRQQVGKRATFEDFVGSLADDQAQGSIPLPYGPVHRFMAALRRNANNQDANVLQGAVEDLEYTAQTLSRELASRGVA